MIRITDAATVDFSALTQRYVRSRIGLRASSVEQLEVTARLIERFRGQRLELHELNIEFAQDFLSHLAKTSSASTVNGKRRILLRLWRYAHRQGATTTAPPSTDDLPKLREPERIPSAWTVVEIGRLINAARSLPGQVGDVPARLWWPAMFLAVYDTSERIGALRSAETLDCSLVDQTILIRANYTKNRRDAYHRLHEQTIDAISAIYDPARRLLFDWPHCRRTLWIHCRKIVDLAGLRTTTRGMGLFHKIRRTTLSYCAASSLALAQQQAGHSDPRITLRHYVDPHIAHRQSAVDVIPRPDLGQGDDRQRLLPGF